MLTLLRYERSPMAIPSGIPVPASSDLIGWHQILA